MTETPSNELPQFTILGDTFQPNSLGVERGFTAKQWIGDASKAIGAYVHVPFCFHKCHYCDFFSIVGKEDQQEAFVRRLIKELAFVGPTLQPLQSIFIGGGTPTLLSEKLLSEMLEAIQEHLPMLPNIEYSIEANPETVTARKAAILIANGINRVSIGAQSFDKELLAQLERWHEPKNVARSVALLKQAGMHNISLDLIYAIPTQTLDQMRKDIETAIALEPTHISCYALIYEPNTPLRTRLDNGTVSRVDHDVEADMFDTVPVLLAKNGYAQYEISNYAREGYKCKHNVMYWKNQNWWPFGPAAAGHVAGRRWKNAPRLKAYLNNSALPEVEDVELLSEDLQAGESFMMGLRMLEGMDRAWVDRLLAQSPKRWRDAVIEQQIGGGLLDWRGEKLILTQKGLHIADHVISELLMRGDQLADSNGQAPV